MSITILDLPNEILVAICSLLCDHCSLPDDYLEGRWRETYQNNEVHPLLALCLVCKRFQQAAQPVLFHCVKNIWKYHVEDRGTFIRNISSQRLLRSLQARPDLARQIQFVDLTDIKFDCPFIDIPSLNNLAMSLGGIPTIDPIWATFAEHRELYDSLLLALLTNIRHLNISIDTGDPDDEIYWKGPLPPLPITHRFREVGPSSYLANLMSLRVDLFGDSMFKNVSEPQIMDLLVGMPNLTNLCLSDVRIDSRYWNGTSVPLAPTLKNLENLVLLGRIRDSEQDYNFLHRWLQEFKRLETFKYYEYDFDRIDTTTYMSCSRILSALEARASTLKSLTLRDYEMNSASWLRSAHLHMFQQLKYISLDWHDIACSSNGKDQVCTSVDALCQGLLPPSIERLDITTGFRICKCLGHIATQRKQKGKFANLQLVRFDMLVWESCGMEEYQRDLPTSEEMRAEM